MVTEFALILAALTAVGLFLAVKMIAQDSGAIPKAQTNVTQKIANDQ